MEPHFDDVRPSRDSDPSRSTLDQTLAAYLAKTAEGARVLWIGGAQTGGPAEVARHAESVRVLDPSGGEEREGGRSRRRRNRGRLRVSGYRQGPFSFERGAFDLIVIPDREVLGRDAFARIDELRDALAADGCLVIGATSPDSDDDYREWHEELSDRFHPVRWLGQGPFYAHMLSTLSEDDSSPEVVVDGQLVDECAAPTRVIAVCGEQRGSAMCVIVQTPNSDERADIGVPDDLSEELAAAHSHAEELEEALAAARRQAETLERELQAAADAESNDEAHALESRLWESVRRIRELEAEVERRGVLVRDLVEATRAAREQSSRELMTDAGVREASLSGAIRGLQDRARELETQRENAEARVLTLEDTVRAAEHERRVLDVELEVVRAKFSAEIGRGKDPHVTQRLSEVLESEARLEHELRDANHRLNDLKERHERAQTERDQARAEVLGLSAMLSGQENRMIGFRLGYERRIAELSYDQQHSGDAKLRGEIAGLHFLLHDRAEALAIHRARGDAKAELELECERIRADMVQRDALILRLQLDLAQEENANRSSEARVDRLVEEVQSLRSALIDASEAVDAAERIKASCEIKLNEARAPNPEIEERIRSLEGHMIAAREVERKLRAERDQASKALRETRAILNALSTEARNGRPSPLPPRPAMGIPALETERQALTEIQRHLEQAKSGERKLDEDDVVEALSGLVARLDRLDLPRADNDIERVKTTVAEVKNGLHDVLGTIPHNDEPTIRRLGILLQLLDRL